MGTQFLIFFKRQKADRYKRDCSSNHNTILSPTRRKHTSQVACKISNASSIKGTCVLIITGMFSGKSESNVIIAGSVLLNYFFPQEIYILKSSKLELKEICQCNSNFSEEEPEAQSKYPFQDCTVRGKRLYHFSKSKVKSTAQSPFLQRKQMVF